MASHVDEIDRNLISLDYSDLLVTPLVEIFGVTIDGRYSDLLKGSSKCNIYGRITVTDQLNSTSFHIYKREKDNPQLVPLGDSLLLTAPSDLETHVIIPSKYVSVSVRLHDEAQNGVLIADETFTLDGTMSGDEGHWLDEYKKKTVKGENNVCARVHYAIFPYAVTAAVNVLYFSKCDDFDTLEAKPPPSEDEWPHLQEPFDEEDVTDYNANSCSIKANIYGTVSASGVINGIGSERSSLLFSKPFEDPIEVKSGSFIELSRSVVAVPAYSSLQIDVSFFHSDDDKSLIARGVLRFKPCDRGIFKKDIIGVNGRIRVQVDWMVALEQFYKDIPNISESINEDAVKRKRPMEQDHYSSVSSSDEWVLPQGCLSESLYANRLLPPGSGRYPLAGSGLFPLVEVFSIVVGSKDLKPLDFHGSVIVQDPDKFYIFTRDKSTPLFCPNSGMLAIVEGNRSFSALQEFVLRVDLRDVDGSIVSKGVVSTRRIVSDYFENRRMCTLFRGKIGFAAVHYSIFPAGVSAVVDVKVQGTNLPRMLKGKIYARIGSSKSSISYQENLFKSILFYDVHDGVLINSGSTLPLVKSVVSLPVYSFLIVEADLSACPGDSNMTDGLQSLKGSIVFTGNGVSPMRIGNDDLFMDVSVEFLDYFSMMSWRRRQV